MLKKNGKIWTFNDKWMDLRRLRHVYLNVEGSGTLSANPMSGYKGTQVTLNPQPAVGSSFDHYDTYGAIVANNKFTFGNQDAYITAHFKANVYNVTVNVSGNGTASANPTSGIMGTEITLSNTPQAHNYFDHYTVNGQTITGSTFTLGAADAVVTAYFQQTVYSVNVTNPTGGHITASANSGHYGDTITLTSTADTGYELDHYVVNGNTIQGNTFTITGNMTVTAVMNAVPVKRISKYLKITSHTYVEPFSGRLAATNWGVSGNVNLYIWDTSSSSWKSYNHYDRPGEPDWRRNIFLTDDCGNDYDRNPEYFYRNSQGYYNYYDLWLYPKDNKRMSFYIKLEYTSDTDLGLDFYNFKGGSFKNYNANADCVQIASGDNMWSKSPTDSSLTYSNWGGGTIPMGIFNA